MENLLSATKYLQRLTRRLLDQENVKQGGGGKPTASGQSGTQGLNDVSPGHLQSPLSREWNAGTESISPGQLTGVGWMKLKYPLVRRNQSTALGEPPLARPAATNSAAGVWSRDCPSLIWLNPVTRKEKLVKLNAR